MSWKLIAEELFRKYGKNWSKIADEMMYLFPELKHFEVKEKIRSFIRKRFPEYSNAQGTSEGNEIVCQNLEPTIKELDWRGNRIIKFGLMGDTQINSKYTQLTYLHAYYDECERQKVRDVYNDGDIDEGEQMRPGHQYECYNQGADDHVDEIVRVYPERKGVTTRFITGNHDASMIKRCGFDIGRAISDKRKDMEYLGRDCAVIYLTPNCTLELSHPWDGSSYALSYKSQKKIDAMQADTKPNILAIGHYHKMENIFYRNVHCFQTACFQAQTPFMRGMNISASMGGWIVEARVDENGYIQNIISQFIPFYKPIKDDYKTWRNKDRFGRAI